MTKFHSILHVGKYFPPRHGGIETFMSQLMNEQVKEGHKVSAIVHADSPLSSDGVYNWRGADIYEAKSFGQIAFVPVAPNYFNVLIKVLREKSPDIIHIHMPNIAPFWLIFLKHFFARQSHVIIHWHSDVLGAAPDFKIKLLYPLYRIFEKYLLLKADRILVTSQNYLDSSKPLAAFKNKCNVIPLGLKINKLDTVTKDIKGNAAFSLIMIGRLTYYKGHSVALRALSDLRDKGVTFRLTIIGDGELRSSLEQLSQKLNLDSCINWLGHVSDEQKTKYLQESELLLLPSVERTEAFGVVLLEAANASVPCIVSDVYGSGMTSVIVDGVNGRIVKNNDVSALTSVLLTLSSNRASCLEMGQYGYSRLVEKFDIKKVSKRITSIYDEINI
ncbi:MAG: glycosyltransferase [Alteromonadaceae bacterium]|nr:glycosyltransferase [Alteromonadaceae bacterium]